MSHGEPREEEVSRALFQGNADAILVLDETGKIVLANDACERLLGYPAPDLAGRHVSLLVPPRFRDHEAHRRRYSENPRPRAMGRGLSLWARRADGREVPVDIALTPLEVRGRRWTAATVRDMRGREVGPDALRVQATALRSAANGIVITDTSGIIVWVNPAACAITGYAADELIGAHTRLLKSGAHDEPFYRQLWMTIRRGETWSGTMVNRRKDGTLYHEEQTIAPVLDEGGQVSHFIAIKQDVSARLRSEEALGRARMELEERAGRIESLNAELREQVIRDPLTGLYNRRYLDEAIGRDTARALRTGEPLAVAALDIDHFKSVNDTFGHPAGDRVLRVVARELGTGLRGSDLACRLGGEEFLVVLSGTPLRSALQLAERWRARFADSPVEVGNGHPIGITVSIGVALLRPPDETAASVMQRADTALLEAKRAGRNRVVSAEP